jgi:hypothetical protein
MASLPKNLRETAELPAVDGCGCFSCQLCYPDELDLTAALGSVGPANRTQTAETSEQRRARLLAAQDAILAGI